MELYLDSCTDRLRTVVYVAHTLRTVPYGGRMALLTACNLVAIVVLGRYVFRLLDDYRQQKRQGIKDPVFHRHQLPEIESDLDCWE